VRYLPTDEHAVLLVVGGVRRLIALPAGEGHLGAVGPLEEHLAPLVVQADPQLVCGHWSAQTTRQRKRLNTTWLLLFSYFLAITKLFPLLCVWSPQKV